MGHTHTLKKHYMYLNWNLTRHPVFLFAKTGKSTPIFFNVYFWERACRGGAERERDRIWSSHTSLTAESMNREIMARAKVGSLTNWATQAPYPNFFLILSQHKNFRKEKIENKSTMMHMKAMHALPKISSLTSYWDLKRSNFITYALWKCC